MSRSAGPHSQEPALGCDALVTRARSSYRRFSYYAVAHRRPREGERVITLHDSRTRSYGTERLVFDAGRLFWTRDAGGKLAILTALVSGTVPAQEAVHPMNEVGACPWR